MSKRKHETSIDTATLTSSAQEHNIFESEPIHDRSSIFRAIFSPSTESPRTLQQHASFTSAMHRILAWREPSAQKSLTSSFAGGSSTPASQASQQPRTKVIYETHSDEDGEKYAGKKLEKLLAQMGVEGTVVVARWYGGVLLGPVRFTWIENCAREAISKWKATTIRPGVDVGRPEGVADPTKRVKMDEGSGADESKDRQRLVSVLKERDTSITVLRGLLAEKNHELKKKKEHGEDEGKLVDGTASNSSEANRSPVSVPDYASMPLSRLRQLEKARDASLTWILKQIDTVEEKLKLFSDKAESA